MKINQHWPKARAATLGSVAMGALVLAGCSSSGSGGGSSSSASSAGGAARTTVMVGDASGHAGVLLTAQGRSLYTSDQEKGSVMCTSKACTDVWVPLVVPAGHTPTGPDQLKLGTIKRPDGQLQVALAGRPLYTFSFDKKAGQVGGDGQKDSFDGTAFSWHAATADGSSTPPTSPGNTGYYGY